MQITEWFSVQMWYRALSLEQQVWDANLSVHAAEAPIYDDIHMDIFNLVEQRRLARTLKQVSALIRSNSKWALDYGCGTGNVTSKLLASGWHVVAADVSEPMLEIVRQKFPNAYSQGRLVTQLVRDKRIDFPDGHFALITIYSVLHHLYDYLWTLEELTRVLAKFGVLYVDHERNENYWRLCRSWKYRLYTSTSALANQFYLRYFKKMKAKPWNIDYSLSDFRTHYDSRIDWATVRTLLDDYGFKVFESKYPSHQLFLPNPLHFLYTRMFGDVCDMVNLVCVKA